MSDATNNVNTKDDSGWGDPVVKPVDQSRDNASAANPAAANSAAANLAGANTGRAATNYGDTSTPDARDGGETIELRPGVNHA